MKDSKATSGWGRVANTLGAAVRGAVLGGGAATAMVYFALQNGAM
jgi:hypothetical protein